MSADTSAMNSIVEDPVIGPEMVALLSRELKAARLRVEKLEAEMKMTDIAKYKQRADSAEVALEALKKSFDDTRTVNQALHARVDREAKRKEADSANALALDEVRKKLDDTETENRLLRASLEESGDSKKKRSKKPIKMLVDKMVSTDEVETQPIEPPDNTELEDRLEKYRQKYKSERASKKELAQTVKNLELELSTLRTENEDRLNKLSTESAERRAMPPPLTFGPDPSWEELNGFMMNLSNRFNPKHLPYDKLRHVCHRTVDLKTYLASDPHTSTCANNFLYLPELIVWCPDKINALALGPLHIYEANHTSNSGWKKRSTFEGLYGKTFCLFEKRHNFVYYLGTYKAICLLDQFVDGISIVPSDSTSRPPIHTRCISSLVDSTIPRVTVDGAGANNTPARKLPTQSEIQNAYLEGTLRVEPLGLQQVGFDGILYENLLKRFNDSSQPASVIPDSATPSVSGASAPASASPAQTGNLNGKRKAGHIIVPRGLEGRDASLSGNLPRGGGNKKRRISEGAPVPENRGRSNNGKRHNARSSSTGNHPPGKRQTWNRNNSKR